MKNSMILFALLLGLAACTNTVATPTSTAVPTIETPVFPTITLSPTDTPLPTASPTPNVPHPTTDSNLSPQNNSLMFLENGTWVVENAAGQVTATWDSAKNEWTYNYDNIKMQVGIAELNYYTDSFAQVREGITVTVPTNMLKPLSSSQQDPNPLVSSGYYGDYIQTTQKGKVTMAEIGVDYRGIILIDKDSYSRIEGKQMEQYAIIFTIQYKDHPDVLNVLLVPINVLHDGSIFTDLFPAGSTDLGTHMPGPMWDTFITILKTKNPIGCRMSIQVYVSDTMGNEGNYYSPDNQTMVNAITAGQPIPSGLAVRLGAQNISMPHDLR